MYLIQICCTWSNVVVEGAVYGLVGGALSQLGDLIASAIKRDTGIKDFGWIFPGHGGFMDRFDSVMFIAPIMYILPIGNFWSYSRECQINWRKDKWNLKRK